MTNELHPAARDMLFDAYMTTFSYPERKDIGFALDELATMLECLHEGCYRAARESAANVACALGV